MWISSGNYETVITSDDTLTNVLTFDGTLGDLIGVDTSNYQNWSVQALAYRLYDDSDGYEMLRQDYKFTVKYVNGEFIEFIDTLPLTPLYSAVDAEAAAWEVQITSAFTDLKINITGEAAKDIKWTVIWNVSIMSEYDDSVPDDPI